MRAWHHTYGLPTLLTNCSNNYGPYHFPEKLIPLMIINALEGMPLPVYGEGENVRDWLFVEDHAEALLAIVARGRGRRVLQHRRRQRAPQSRSRRGDLRSRGRTCARATARLAARTDHLRHTTGPATTCAMRSTRQDRARARLAAAPQFRSRAAQDRAMVSRQPGLVAGHSLGRLSRRAAWDGGLKGFRVRVEDTEIAGVKVITPKNSATIGAFSRKSIIGGRFLTRGST